MNWTEIIIAVPVEEIDKAGDIANMVVPYGIYIEDYSNLEQEVEEIANINLIDDDLLAKDRSKGYIHIYISPEENPTEAISFLRERYNSVGIHNDICTEDCKQEDWINNWKKYFKPIKVGEKLLIRPTWEEVDCNEGRTVIHLEPGLAFGTGTHETTRLCLELLEQYVTPDSKLLDVGCGSGILSVASLLLGAKLAVGVDIDEMAVKTAVENAKINNVEDRFNSICGSLTDKVSGKYNIVVANIVADIIITLTSDVKNYMEKDTIYIMSGIIDTRLSDVKAVLVNDFDIITQKEEKGWVALAVKLK